MSDKTKNALRNAIHAHFEDENPGKYVETWETATVILGFDQDMEGRFNRDAASEEPTFTVAELPPIYLSSWEEE